MENRNTNLKSIQTVHLAMCMVSVIFLLIVSVINYKKNGDAAPIFGDGPYYFMAPLLALAALIGGSLIFKKSISAIEIDAELSEKLKKYQSALIARHSFVSGATTFNTAAYLLTGHYFFAGIAMVLILLMFAFRPTKFRASEDLQLNYTDLN